MDTTGGQSGSPVWRQKASGPCIRSCAMALHTYSTDPVAGPVWAQNNAGTRLTRWRIGYILDIAGQNGG
jgi:V8-like Glu-specific endopeptidase